MTLSIIGLLLVGSMASAVSGKGQNNVNDDKLPAHANAEIKNVIIMVPDGCSQSVQTLARWYSGDKLQLDSMVTGMVSTYMADSLITDSASAATAFSTGYKTTDGFLSVGPRSDTLLSTIDTNTVAEPYVPLATVLEGARLEGKATGLVATSEIPHATPAAYASHVDSRKLYDDIIEQMVYGDIDVVFAGGKDYLNNSRGDGEDLIEVLEGRGYQFVENGSEMAALTNGKAWGMFAGSAMAPEIDRAITAPEQPTIAAMTSKAIELLSQDDDGFFLMVEGSQIDWAGHANDPVYMVTDFIAFDEAVREAVEFAKEDGHTLVIVFPDHNTGGMTIGSKYDESYTKTTVEDVVAPLRNMKCSYSYLDSQVDEKNATDVKAKVKEWMGIELTDSEVAQVVSTGKFSTLQDIINNNHTVIGWTTYGHIGDDVPLWAYGPKKLEGLVDNTEIATHVASKLGFELSEVNKELFVDVEEAFPGAWTLDKTDSKNPVLVINYNGKVCELPVNKDILTIDSEEETELEGVVVYAPKAGNGIGKVYIPQEAVDIIR